MTRSLVAAAAAAFLLAPLAAAHSGPTIQDPQKSCGCCQEESKKAGGSKEPNISRKAAVILRAEDEARVTLVRPEAGKQEKAGGAEKDGARSKRIRVRLADPGDDARVKLVRPEARSQEKPGGAEKDGARSKRIRVHLAEPGGDRRAAILQEVVSIPLENGRVILRAQEDDEEEHEDAAKDRDHAAKALIVLEDEGSEGAWSGCPGCCCCRRGHARMGRRLHAPLRTLLRRLHGRGGGPGFHGDLDIEVYVNGRRVFGHDDDDDHPHPPALRRHRDGRHGHHEAPHAPRAPKPPKRHHGEKHPHKAPHHRDDDRARNRPPHPPEHGLLRLIKPAPRPTIAVRPRHLELKVKERRERDGAEEIEEEKPRRKKGGAGHKALRQELRRLQRSLERLQKTLERLEEENGSGRVI